MIQFVKCHSAKPKSTLSQMRPLHLAYDETVQSTVQQEKNKENSALSYQDLLCPFIGCVEEFASHCPRGHVSTGGDIAVTRR